MVTMRERGFEKSNQEEASSEDDDRNSDDGRTKWKSVTHPPFPRDEFGAMKMKDRNGHRIPRIYRYKENVSKS